MRRIIVVIIYAIFLVSCERPATVANWSPINDVTPSSPSALVYALKTKTAAQTATPSSSPTASPTLNFAALPDEFLRSSKGYELMSWQTDETWQFTLVTGTNREKTFEELMSPANEFSEGELVKVTVTGVDQLKKIIDRLPSGEQIVWSGMDLSGQVPEGTVYFSYPPQTVIDEMVNYCSERNITLVSLKETE